MVDLGTLGGANSYGSAINDTGQVAGYGYKADDPTAHAFRNTGTPGEGGALEDLGALVGTFSMGLAINDAGFVVGQATRSANDRQWPTLWRTNSGNTAVDLDAWLDATHPSLGAYWTLNNSSDINYNGLITGVGLYDDGPGGLSDGPRAYILDASSLVPEPSSLALGALGALAVRRNKRNTH